MPPPGDTPRDAPDPLDAYYARMVDPRPLRALGKQQWLRRRGEVRAGVLRALALDPLPERLPLAAQTGGCLDRDGYRVERLYWQTWPDVWASGWLYLPAEPSPQPRPAVLNPHGHWKDGARHPVVQSRLISLARLGYVALAVDSVHAYDYSVGVTPLTLMTWNNIRALDLLCARHDVDRERLGVAGASGGAQQAMYLMAVDDRIRAAVLAVLVSYFARILMPRGHHCPCNHVPGLMRFTDEPEIAGIAAPRAVLYLTVDGDWTAPFPRHELGELRALYRVWGQPDRLGHRQFPGPHDFHREMREEAYRWFERELRGRRDAGRVAEPPHSVEDPTTLAALDAPPAGDRGTEGILAWYRRRVVAQPPRLEGRDSRRRYQERARQALAELLGEPPGGTTVTLAARVEGPGVSGGVMRLSVRSEPEVRVPLLWAPDGTTPAAAALLLHPGGKEAALATAAAHCLREAGWSLLAADVRLCGELERDWLHNSLLWGRPEAGMAVTDSRACLQWLLEHEEVSPERVVLVGWGKLGLVALLAAGLDERVSGVIADAGGTTYRDGGEGLPVIPNVLRVGDTPQLASLVAPRPLWLWNVPGDRVGFSSRRYFDWTRRTYQGLGGSDSLEMDPGAELAVDLLAQWLAARLSRPR